MTCDVCGQELVEVDNPLRREVRHRRGVQCRPKDEAEKSAQEGERSA